MEPQQNNENEEPVIEKDVQDTTIINEETIVIEHTEHTETLAPKKPMLSLPAAVLTGLALIALAIILVVPNAKNAADTTAAPTAQPETPTSVPAEVVQLRTDDRILGNANTADVLIFEYSDSDCPYCARFHPTLHSVVDDYQGRVAWVYRYFPLDMHPNAYTEAIALECSARLGGNNGFWNYLDTIVNVTLNPDPKSNNALVTFATDQGLNADQFKACFSDSSVSQRIDGDIAEANDIGARGTPFSVAVNKKTGEQVVIPGAYPIESVKELIDSIL